jgi:hypothetical protein
MDSVGAFRMSSMKLRPLTTTWYLSVEATLKTVFGYWQVSRVYITYPMDKRMDVHLLAAFPDDITSIQKIPYGANI